MGDNVFKKIVSFVLVAIMTLSLCSPGLVTSYATQATDTTDATDTTEQQTEAQTEKETTVETQTETQTETESETKADKKEAESDSTENETAESYKEKEGSHVITEFLDAQDYYMSTGDADELINGMPEYLYALFDDGETARVYGSWDVVDNKEDGEDLILSMKFVLPLGYYVADGVDVPTVTMTGLGFYGVSAAKSSATKTGNTVSGKDEYTLKGSKQTRTALYIGTVKGSSKAETDYWKIYYGGGDVRERFHTPKMAGNNYAFCLHPELNAPTGDLKVYQLNDIYGTGLKFGTYTDKKAILKVLYYGHMDPEKTESGRFKSSGLQKVLTDYMSNHTKDIFYDWNDNDDSNRTAKMSYFVTHCMAARAYGDATWDAGLNGVQKEAVNKVWDAMAKLADPPNPDVKIYKNDGKTSSSDNAWVTFSAKDGKTVVNRSHDFIVKCDASNSVTVKVPDKITLYKGNDKTGKTNANVTLKNGDTFHLEAAATQTGTTTISGTGSHTTKYQVYIALDDAKAQDIVYLHASDSQGRNASFSVTWGTPREYKVKKVWDDNNNASGSRPNSVTLSLWYGTDEKNRKKTKYTDVTLKAPDWSATVTGIPAATTDGKPLYWGFYEDSVPSGYTFVSNTGYAPWTTINNPFYEATATNKANNGKLYIQKESADKTLTNNNSKYSLAGAEYTVYGTNNNGTLSDSKGKLTTDANGKSNELTLQPGKYYIKETKVSTGFALDPTIYTVEVVAGKTVTTSTTSKEPPLISMKVTKKWDDQNDKFKVRPASITLDLYSGSSESSMTTKVGKSVTLNANNSWTQTITGLPQTDSSNNRIYYTFKESSVPANYTSTTSSITKNTAGDGYEVVITNKLPTGFGQVKKTSTFTGLTNNNSKYPLAGAEYTIYTDKACTKKANYSGTMTTTSTGDSNAIELIPGTYYAKETKKPSGYQLDPTVYTVVVKAGETATFTSKEIPIVSASVKKVWSDQNDKFKVRPSSITAYLYSGTSEKNLTKTTQSVVLNAGNSWSGTISNLPQTDSSGTRIYYSFKEAEVPNHYDESVSTAEVNTTRDGYTVTLTNTLTPGTVTVQKTSTFTGLTSGNSNYPLAGAVYEIYTDQACTKKATYSGTMTTTSTGASNAIELLPGTYYIREKSAPNGYQLDDTVHKVVVEKGKAATFTSKEIPLVSVKVTKSWDDQSNKYKIRPTSITAYLYSGTSESNMTKTSTAVTLNAGNSWTQTVDKLPQTKADGTRIYYSFKEAEVPANYKETVSAVKPNTNNTGYEVTITNKIQLGKGKVQKASTYTAITGGNTHYALTGAEYTIYTDQACKNRAIYDEKLITTASGATNEVELVPGTYYIKETKAPNGYKLDPKVYTAVVTADKTTTVTSKDVPLVSLTVKKVWEDKNNKFQIRPTSLTVYLYSGGAANSLSKTDRYVTLNAGNNWTATINDLPQTDDNGNTIYYSFKEDQVPLHYEQSVADTKMNTAKTGYDVTITNTLPTGYGQVQKVSFDTTLTNGNSKYPLNGAEYTIYTDQACTKRATYEGTMTTMTDGKSNAIELVPGTYYVKETKAPNGYKEDPTVYTLVVTANKTTTFTSKEVPLVSLTVKKTWTDQENKFGVRPTTLVVYLYSGSSEKNLTKTDRFVTLNATNKWTDTINDLPQTDDKGNRIYYGFKEEKTPEFYNETDSAATLTTAKNGYEVSITNELQIGYLKLLKTSLKPDLTNGNANYSLKDAVYTVYTDKECKNKAKYFGELRTDEKGATGTIEILPGTYYVKETTAPKGFKLSDEVFTVTIKDKETVNIDAVDTPIYSKLSLKKVSADEGRTNGLTDGNACYSLEGAEYYVYTDAACKTRAKDSSGKDITLVTKADGTTNEAEVVAATYYVREMKASKGYYLDDCNTKTPHSITLELGKDGSVTCTEQPMDDPFMVSLTKKSYKNGVEITNNAPSLEGAIFEVDYYQNTDGKTSGAPAKKWYFKTNEKGNIIMANEKFYVSSTVLDDGTKVVSDSLYRDEDGNVIYPLGTYTLKEVKSPTYYEIKGTATIKGTGTTVDDPSKPLTLIIKTDPDKGTPGIYDGAKPTSGRISVTNEVGITYNEEVYEGSLKVVKYGDDNKPLAGVKFKLVGDDGSVYTGTTDKNGVYTFKELMPQHYVLTETETPDGYTLLKDNVDVNVPYEVSDQKAKDAKMDTSKAVHDASKNMYYFYDITYNIKNGQAFPVVYTGGDQTMLYIGMTAALAMIGLGGFMVIRRRRER